VARSPDGNEASSRRFDPAPIKLPARLFCLPTYSEKASQDGNASHSFTNSCTEEAPNSELRRHEHLTEAELDRLIKATQDNRYSRRDATMVLLLRAAEPVDLRWEQIDFRTPALHVRRVKQGTLSTHPILGDELRALRRLRREQEPKSPFVVHVRARCSIYYGWLRPNDRACWKGSQAVI